MQSRSMPTTSPPLPVPTSVGGPQARPAGSSGGSGNGNGGLGDPRLARSLARLVALVAPNAGGAGGGTVAPPTALTTPSSLSPLPPLTFRLGVPLRVNTTSAGATTGSSSSSSWTPSSSAATASTKLPPPPAKRRRVTAACRACQASHVQCETRRPCARCVRRGLAHLCLPAIQTPETTVARGVPIAAEGFADSSPRCLTAVPKARAVVLAGPTPPESARTPVLRDTPGVAAVATPRTPVLRDVPGEASVMAPSLQHAPPVSPSLYDWLFLDPLPGSPSDSKRATVAPLPIHPVGLSVSKDELVLPPLLLADDDDNGAVSFNLDDFLISDVTPATIPVVDGAPHEGQFRPPATTTDLHLGANMLRATRTGFMALEDATSIPIFDELASYRRMDRYLSAHMSLAGRRRLGTLLQLYEVASSAMVTRALLFEPVLARFAARWQARLLHRHDCPAVACVIAEDAGGGDIGSPVSATTSSLARLVTDTAGAAADRRALPAARPPPQSQSQQQPVAMWRRTGELLAGSHTLADCLGLPWSALNPANPATPAAMRDFSGASVSDASVAQPSGIHTDVATAAAVASLASGVTGRGPNYNFPPQEPAAVSADLAEAAPATAGAMTVYDWMTEESAVAYWEAFLAVAFGRGGGGGAAARGAVSAATSATAAPRAPSATLLPDAAVLRGLVLRVPWRGWGFTSTAGGSGGGGGSMAVAGACCRHCGGPASAATAQQQQHYVHPGGGGGGNGSRLGRRPSRFECVLAFRVRRTADGAAPLCVHGAFSFV